MLSPGSDNKEGRFQTILILNYVLRRAWLMWCCEGGFDNTLTESVPYRINTLGEGFEK